MGRGKMAQENIYSSTSAFIPCGSGRPRTCATKKGRHTGGARCRSRHSASPKDPEELIRMTIQPASCLKCQSRRPNPRRQGTSAEPCWPTAEAMCLLFGCLQAGGTEGCVNTCSEWEGCHRWSCPRSPRATYKIIGYRGKTGENMRNADHPDHVFCLKAKLLPDE